MLAVDDEPQVLRYIRDTLAKAGYDPIVTGEPERALRLMAEERPEQALLDLLLPGRDGIELMRAVQEIADVPVIFISAYGREDLIARAFNQGAVDYLVKPFSPAPWAGGVHAAGTLFLWRHGRRLRPAPGHPVRPDGAPGVPAAGRAGGERR